MKWALAAAVVLGALAPAAQAGVVAGGPGDQSDPDIAGALVVYTHEENGGSEIRYRDFDTGLAGGVPSVGAFDFLGDVHGSTITFTRIGDEAGIWVHDVTTGNTAELAPDAGYTTDRRASAIGEGLVVWQDLGFGPDIMDTEIVAHENGQPARLTTDAALDKNPSVSPDGGTVVWTKCATLVTGCDIHTATRGVAGWDVRAITGAEGEESLPDSDGDWTVYSSSAGGEQDILAQPDGGGPVRRLSLPSFQRNPNVDRAIVTFESFDESQGNLDVYAWDLLTNEVRRVTQTTEDESLNGVSVTPDGHVRAVWTGNHGMTDGFDIEGSAFQRPSAFRVIVQQPIDADGSSTFSARRGVVPVKFAGDTCRLPPASLRLTRLGSAGDQPVDESVYASKADSGSAFRIADCAYHYHLAASALGAGRYRVEAVADGAAAGGAVFTLR